MKSFKKRSSVLIAVIIVTLLSSCQDFIDEQSYKPSYLLYETAEGVEALVASCYQNQRWTANGENFVRWEDFGSDIYMTGADGTARDSFHEYSSIAMIPTNSVFSDFWNNNYTAIAFCNLALNYIDNHTKLADDLKGIRKGEALFLRAYYYYDLVKHFGDIPISLEPVSSPKVDYVRSPQKVVWAQIISDLRKAWELLPWSADGKITGDYGRASKGAAGHLLAKAYFYRYGTIIGGTQSKSNMQEDRGAKTSDLDSVIYYASRVANYGEGAGSNSPHALAPNFSDLWYHDPVKGMTAEYLGSEAIFSVLFSQNPFYNNGTSATNTDVGNQMHIFWTMWIDGYTPTTASRMTGHDNVVWATSNGMVRDMLTGRPYRRLVPAPWVYRDDGLFGRQAYDAAAADKPGKLIDARLYKSHVWAYFSNGEPSGAVWRSYSNGAGSFDPASIGKTAGDQRFTIGDTALFISVENLDNRFPNGLPYEKLALARAKESYWYIPMQSMFVPQARDQTTDRDGICNAFPSLIKHHDGWRASVQYLGGGKNFIRMRTGETLLLLSEAYARKGDWANAAATLNMVRMRGAWKEGELKHAQFWKYDGGTWNDRFTSTEEEMKVSEGFLSKFSPIELTDFYVEEYGRELMGELNRFEILTRYGADYWINRIKPRNHFAAVQIQEFHRFRPIPQAHIDLTDPPEANPQNYGY